MIDSNGNKMYTPAEVAEMYCVKKDTVWSWIRNGQLMAYRVGGRLYRISDAHLRRFDEHNKTMRKSY